MSLQFLPLITFALITTYTPGPNNISSASMGVLFGYGRTVRYLAGIACGFFLVMLLCAFLCHTMLSAMPILEHYVRWLGAAYILWLAYSILKSSIAGQGSDQRPLSFANGLALQVLNPKVVVYGLTIYSTFLAPIAGEFHLLLLSAALLALNAFMATSTWALFGAAIRTKLQHKRFRTVVNVALSLLLVYSAVSLSGVFTSQ